MSNGVVLREPPSIVDSESGYTATTGIDPDCVVLGNLDQKREDMMNNVAAEQYAEQNGMLGSDVISVSQRQIDHHSIEKKVLKPYDNILKMLGMRNFGSPDNPFHRALSFIWTVLIFVVIITGYALNMVFCNINQDKMTKDEIIPVCKNKTLTYNYIEGMCRSSLESIVPSGIHFVAFLYTFWIFRVKQSEQLEALVQKALVSQRGNTNSQMRRDVFITRLKVVYASAYVCLWLLFGFTVVNSYCGKALVWWRCSPQSLHNEIDGVGEGSPIDHYYRGLLVAVPSFAIFIFLTPILLNFTIQARLIQYLITELRATLREKRNTLKAMMQEAHDISSFVHKMNSESAPAMSFILFYLAYGIFVDVYSILETVGEARTIENIFTNEGCDEGVEWQYRQVCRTVKTYGRISFVVVMLRDVVLGSMFFMTIYQGCKIATSHKRLINQALELRVFGYNQNTCEELDSFHYYLRALKMRAKVFQYPMETKRLLLPLMFGILVFLCFDLEYQFL
ncbi:uncharacterized protein LOC134825339 isoform X2 [Bolinopsis microptera]|uniref:uncharacterized protein LOC134825339 isoform X2 n=1 Tax=Bolinopsis microptera TaxID=2820187 RepID=UPI00307AEED3